MMQPDHTSSTSHSNQDTKSKEYATRNHDVVGVNHLNDVESDNITTTTATSSNSMVDSAAFTSCAVIKKSLIVENDNVADDRSTSEVCPNNDNSETTNNSNIQRFHRMRRFLSPNTTNSAQHIQSATDIESRGRATTTATMLALDDQLNGEYELDDHNSTNDLFVQQRNTSPRNSNNSINNTPIALDDPINDDHHHLLVDTRSNSVGRFRARDDDFIFMMMNNNNIAASSPLSLSDNRSSSVSSNSSRRRRHQQNKNDNFNQHTIYHPNEDHDEYGVHIRYDIGRDSGKRGLIRPRRILHLSQAEREEMLLQRIQKRQEKEDRQNERHLRKRESSQSRKVAKVIESDFESSEIVDDDSSSNHYETDTRSEKRPWLWKRSSTTQTSTPSSSSLNDVTSTTTPTTTGQQNVYPNRQQRNPRLLSVEHVYAALEGKGRYNGEHDELKEEKVDETFKKVSIIQQHVQDHPLAASFLVESNGRQQPSPLESLTTEQRIQDACSFFYQNSIDYKTSTMTGKISSRSNHPTRPRDNFGISSATSNTENDSHTTSSYYPWRMIVPRGTSSQFIDCNYNTSTNEMYNSFGDDNNYNYNYYRSSNFNQSSPDRVFRSGGSYSQPSQGYFRRLFTLPSTFGNNNSNNVSIGPEHQQSFTNYHPFNYSDAVPVLAPPVLQRYLSKFEQFNEPITLEEQEFHNSNGGTLSSNLTNSRNHIEEVDDEDNNYHELQLSESEDSKGLNGNKGKGRENAQDLLTADTVKLSTLFYECDGRILMKLPRDRVKLVHDPDIQPGIISVEQWRHPVKSQSIGSRGANCNYHTDYCKEDLRYTLSVPDNIYRKIVSEMSYRLSDKFGFYHGCCSAEDSDYYYHHPSRYRKHPYHSNHMHRRFDKVDIRVAIFLLLTFLFILCFFTLWYNEA